MKDENILTGCKTNRSSFSGFVRLVPKMMNPVLMPAEWSALSKLKDRTEVHTSLTQCRNKSKHWKNIYLIISGMLYIKCCVFQKDVVIKSFT